jgi:hypothetical protein
MSHARYHLLILLGISASMMACSAPAAPTPTPIFALPTLGIITVPTISIAATPLADLPPDLSIPPAATKPITSTQPITISVTPPATAAAAASATPTVSASPAAGTMRVKVFMIALNDAGKTGTKIGCGDSLVAVERSIPNTQGVLNATLNELLSIREKTVGAGLYNALYQSTLKVDGVSLASGKATIQLSGKLVRAGVCDDPRIKAQIEETALQFSTVKTLAVTINGVTLDKALSEK